MELKSGATSSTPPAAPRARSAASSSGQALAGYTPTSEIKPTPQDEDPDYETIESTDYETIPSDLLAKTTKTETKINFGEFNFKESFGENESFPFEAEKKSNTEADPFASEPSLKKSEESPPSSAVFASNDDFFSSDFGGGGATAAMTDFPVDDPFAPKHSNTPQESQATDAFASTDAFESAFNEMSPFDTKKNSEKTEEDSCNNPSNHDAFDSAFGTTTEFSESKPTENTLNEQDGDAQKDVSWSNVFGDDNQKDPSDIDQKADSSWSAAFEDSKSNDAKPTKTDKKEVSFAFDDSFGAKFDGEKEDEGKQPDNAAAEPDFSWTNAFNDQSQKEVTFSWDDAFGGNVDSKNGEVDNKKGQTDNNFSADAFTDAFSSTPFKPPQPKDDSGVKSNGAFTLDNFDDVLSPMKPNPPAGETDENTKDKTNDIFANFSNDIFNPLQPVQPAKPVNERNEEAKDEFDTKTNNTFPMADFGDVLSPVNDSESKANEAPNTEESGNKEEVIDTCQSSEPGSNDAKPKLADMEDLESGTTVDQDNTELQKERDKAVCNTIPQIIEPPKEDDSDDDDGSVRPGTLPVLPTKTTGEKESPTAPPPLPPRPTMAPLPSLPPRPRTQSSPLVGQIPPTPPRPVGSSPAPKTGTPKRAPPALPPRIDLEDGKNRATSVDTSKNATAADPFSISEPSWQADWPGSTSQNIKKENDSNSKKSPDPFGDAFFTDFNFTASSENDEHKIDSGNDSKTDLFSEPFASKSGSEDIFKADFGGVDPFGDFTSNKSTVDPFSSDGKDVFSTNDGKDVFPGFSTNNDPFLDSMDPFAEKGTLNNDPFAVSPKKDSKDGNMSLQLTKVGVLKLQSREIILAGQGFL